MLVLAACCFAMTPTVTAAERHEAKEEKKSRVKHDANGEAVITLDEATRKRIGLKVEAIVAATLSPEVKGYGRVLDPAPLTAAVTDLTSAQVTLDADAKEMEQVQRLHESEIAAAESAAKSSGEELARVQTLFKQNNASARALQAAEAAARKDQLQVQSQQALTRRAMQQVEATAHRDQVALEAIRLKLVQAWGGAIAGQSDRLAFVQSLVALEAVLIRIDLPAGETLGGTPRSARIVPLVGEATPVEAACLGSAPNADPQSQGQGFLFLLKPNSPRLVPGAALTGFLPQPGQPQSGALVPRAAVLRVNGRPSVYVQTGENVFTRREIALDHPLADGWFVTRGVKPGDKVVVIAAQVLLAEELKGQIQPGN